jgi:signal peptidase I
MSKTKKLIIKILTYILSVLPFLFVAIIGFPIAGMAYTETTKVVGLRTIPVNVVGTGSMYPSLFWESSEGGPEDESKKVIEEYRTTPHLYRLYDGFPFLGKTFLRRDIGYGDIVSFRKEKTIEILKTSNKDVSSGFIKRVIAVGGDAIELRDGFVYKNGQLLSEPYISSPRSTYGGTIIKDCIKTTVPQDKYLVLGDNRKVSTDSRFELGFISREDIEYLLPYSEQRIYESLWRDTRRDSELLGQPTLSSTEFVDLINKVRVSKGLAKLTGKLALVKSATVRGEKLLIDRETSYKMDQAIASVGYKNIILGEFVSYGHYTAKELLENLLFNTDTAKQILHKDFADIGISNVNKEISSCPSQVIVGHLGGYVPAQYDASVLKSWTELHDNLRAVIPSWEKALDYDTVDKDKLNALLTIFRRRLRLAEDIINTIEKKEWFTVDQESRIKADDADSQTAKSLSEELNKE